MKAPIKMFSIDYWAMKSVSDILVEEKLTKAVIDTVSIITTMCLEFYNSLQPKPQLHSLEDFNLKINGANGQQMHYLGYVELSLTIPFLKNKLFDILVLVVPIMGKCHSSMKGM